MGGAFRMPATRRSPLTAPFDFSLSRPNSNPSRVTDAMWWLWLQLDALEPETQLGGIYADKSGFHNTRAANQAKWPGNYSVRDAIDLKGPSDKAAAIDWTFPSAQRGDYSLISKYFTRFLNAAKANDPRLAGWKEGFGQADSDSEVEGWDVRKDCPSTSDSSHLWHIHFSESRAHVESFWNKAALLSVLSGESLADYLARGGQLVGTVVQPPVTPPATPLTEFRLGSRVLAQGMRGTDVREMQGLLRTRGRMIVADGDFGPKTHAAVIDFQGARWLTKDGQVGSRTLAALQTNIGVRVMKRGMNGTDVHELQRLLNVRGAALKLDGDFGSLTYGAVRAYQKARRLGVDGEAGPQTVNSLRA